MRTWIIAPAIVAALCSGRAAAKGLDTLSQNNPEGEGGDAEDGDGGSGAASAAPMQQSATSRALDGKLFLASTGGFVFASKSSGDWHSDGMSDVSIGYKMPFALGAKSGAFATYRYSPISVHGSQDGQSYRGIWETHLLGGRINFR